MCRPKSSSILQSAAAAPGIPAVTVYVLAQRHLMADMLKIAAGTAAQLAEKAPFSLLPA